MRLTKIERPSKLAYEPRRKLSKLAFPDGYVGLFFMRGGVCWPIPVDSPAGVRYQGAAIMCGHDVETGLTYVFEEYQFTTPLACAGKPGLDAFMLAVWRLYFARHYYHEGDLRVARTFIAPMEKQSKAYAERRLAFHFHYLNEFNPDRDASVIWQYMTREMLFLREGLVYDAIGRLKSGAEPLAENVFARALAATLYGLDLAPWKYVD